MVVVPADVNASSIVPSNIKLGISTWTSPTLELFENCLTSVPALNKGNVSTPYTWAGINAELTVNCSALASVLVYLTQTVVPCGRSATFAVLVSGSKVIVVQLSSDGKEYHPITPKLPNFWGVYFTVILFATVVVTCSNVRTSAPVWIVPPTFNAI